MVRARTSDRQRHDRVTPLEHAPTPQVPLPELEPVSRLDESKGRAGRDSKTDAQAADAAAATSGDETTVSSGIASGAVAKAGAIAGAESSDFHARPLTGSSSADDGNPAMPPDGPDTASPRADPQAQSRQHPPSPARTAAAAAPEPEPGADTHVVGFEGHRNGVVVVAKKMNFQRWLVGSDEADARVDQFWPSNLVLTVLGVVSAIALPTMLVNRLDSWWYWLVVAGGVGNLFNQLASRNPTLLWRLLGEFGESRHPKRKYAACLLSAANPPIILGQITSTH